MPSVLLYAFLWQAACLEALGRQSPLVPLTEYIFVSQPGHKSVAVTEVDALTRQVIRESRTVISTGLHEPCGLAIDHNKQRLYVADPKSHKVFMYKMHFGDDGLSMREDEQFIAVRDLTARWVTVDEKGTLFATDEARSFIAEVKSEELAELGNSNVRPRFHKLYNHDQTKQVDKPGGIAVDGHNVYWGNRARGKPYGSLLSASEDPEGQISRGVPTMVQALSKNVDKVYGVCASPTLVFYTGGARTVYGAKVGTFQQRGSTTVLLNDYAAPRGCVWDGDGTVFLADKGGDAVWSFPSSMHGLGLVQASKLFDVEDPYGVAVFRPSLALEVSGFLRAGAIRLGPALASSLVVVVFIILGVNA